MVFKMGVVMNVVTRAIITSIQKTLSEIIPKSFPKLITINSIKARVFINTPMHEASLTENPEKYAANPQPAILPIIDALIIPPAISQSCRESSDPILVLNPV
jgi:hypothetical protein